MPSDQSASKSHTTRLDDVAPGSLHGWSVFAVRDSAVVEQPPKRQPLMILTTAIQPVCDIGGDLGQTLKSVRRHDVVIFDCQHSIVIAGQEEIASILEFI